MDILECRFYHLTQTVAPLEDEDVKFDTRSHDLADVDEEEPKIFGLDEPPEEEDEFDIDGSDYSAMKVHVLPLYSQLHVEEQMRIFKPVPEGCRMIVIATNVAETSLTIPGVRYVFDSGRVKRKIYDGKTGVQSFEVGWISKASADQRAGRAGRTGPGHCYRLYSSAVYERDFAEHEQPEILRMPIEGVVLTLKSIGLQHVVNFPFPTPPDRLALSKAEKLLTYLGAIEANGAITPAGRELALFSLHPRYGRMLLIGQAQKCTAYAIALVSALAVADLFIPESQAVPCVSRHDKSDTASDSDSDRRVRKRGNQMKIAQVREITEFDASNEVRRAYARAQKLLSANSATCDAIKYLTAICASDHATSLDLFAASHFIRLQALKETVQLRQQLARVIQVRQGSSSMPPISKLPKPDKTLLQIIPQIAAAGYIDCVAQRADLAGKGDGKYVIKKVSRATYVPYVLLFPIEADVAHSGSVNGTAGSRNNNSNSSSSHNDNEYVYCHPSSLLARSRPASLPQYVTYTHLSRPSNSSSTGADADADAVDQKPARVRMHPLAPVTAKQLVSLTAGTPLLQWSSPLSTVGRYSLGSAGAGASAGTSAGVLHPNGDHDQQQPSSTEKGEARREVWSIPSLVGPPGSLGWPLAATKIVQRKDAAIGWTYERFA